jgi:hypothetical protein
MDFVDSNNALGASCISFAVNARRSENEHCKQGQSSSFEQGSSNTTLAGFLSFYYWWSLEYICNMYIL